jgi:geranylgeranyl diphosphate synthase type II
MDRTDALDHARTVARALAGAALFEFDAYFERLPPSRDIRFMRSLLTWVLQRAH